MSSLLAFNEALAISSTDAIAFGDDFAATSPKIREFSIIGAKSDFWFKATSVDINGLWVMACANSGIYFDRDDCLGTDFIIPIDGYLKRETDGSKYHINARELAFLTACERRKSETSGSSVTLRLDPNRVNLTGFSMFGSSYTKMISDNTRKPALEIGNISFFSLFQSVFQQINSIGSHSDFLQRLSIDDTLYRLTLACLFPNLCLVGGPHNSYLKAELSMLCEFLRANLTSPVSLSEMEKISGLTARTLQRSFLKGFGLSPKQWLIKQRLHAARAVIKNPHHRITITSLAYDFCFSSSSEFARYYKLEFGELPSQTHNR